jgi:hypothetical protein
VPNVKDCTSVADVQQRCCLRPSSSAPGPAAWAPGRADAVKRILIADEQVARADAANRARDVFLAKISHEEMHGGTIHADSKGSGLGATFVVELPLLRASFGDPASVRHDGPPRTAPHLSVCTPEHPRSER